MVKALLPGTAGCAAIVTSRRFLSTLPGARHFQLDVLPEDEAVALLGAIAGESRLLTELAAAHDVVRRCAHLPLALRMAGARLLARPQWTVRILDRLVDSYLLETHLPGRYRLHDLLRSYARERVESTVDQTERAASLTRVLALDNSVAWKAHELWRPGHNRQ